MHLAYSFFTEVEYKYEDLSIDGILDAIQDVQPPPHLGSWQDPVDALVILDNWDENLLRRAAEMALG
jgi:hypothetical protein